MNLALEFSGAIAWGDFGAEKNPHPEGWGYTDKACPELRRRARLRGLKRSQEQPAPLRVWDFIERP